MTDSFLSLTAQHLYQNHKNDLDKCCIVLPNKRSAIFLKRELANAFAKTIWLPKIISIEDFILEISELSVLQEIDLICTLYESYKTCIGVKAEPFDNFLKWGNLILQDFNEIDKFLVDAKQIYGNLKNIKDIENWSLGEEHLSQFQLDYLEFMNSLSGIYEDFKSKLLAKGNAYNGLTYRLALEKLDGSEFINQFSKFIFCGFNALNKCEIKIIQYLKNKNVAELIWDADEYYLNNENQEAGYFLRQNFELFPSKEQTFISNNLITKKEIKIYSVAKQIGQAQVVQQCVNNFLSEGISPSKIAIVLVNEKMLLPVLNLLPEDLGTLNITMEYPLNFTSCYDFINQLINIQVNFKKQNKNSSNIYYKDLLSALRHPLFNLYLNATHTSTNLNLIISQINQRNMVYVSSKNLKDFFKECLQTVEPCLIPANSVLEFCHSIQNILTALADILSKNENRNSVLELEFINALELNFNRLIELVNQYSYFNNFQTFKQLFIQIIGKLSVPFVGEPLQGLQIMGLLETRTLDFENIIVVNANEGILPTAKSINSFIPNDLKRAFNMPLYSEKDAIYAYHFYRLLQRGKKIHITYNSETDTFGKGEKSRFVTQLLMELKAQSEAVNINEIVVSNAEDNVVLEESISISKNSETLQAIKAKALDNGKYGGLSPSSIILFKDCSLKFYFRYSAKIKENESVEEIAEANTFGSILHKSLELLYEDLKGKFLSKQILIDKEKQVDNFVRQAYLEQYDNQNPSGKNILQEEVLRIYTKKVLQGDLEFLEELEAQKQSFKILELEKEFTASIKINIENEEKEIFIKGKIDRIDKAGEDFRIIDYKTSIQPKDKFIFETFEELFSNKEYDKQLQLIIYAWLLYKNNYCLVEKMIPGILALKKYSKELTCLRANKKDALIFSTDFFGEFETTLKKFLVRIFDTTVAFAQTENEEICQWCEYNVICQKVK